MACEQNLIRDKVFTGVSLRSDTALYTVIRAVNASDNLFEAVQEGKSARKVLLKVYDVDDVQKFHNEVEKLNLLSQILDEIGENGFLVQMLDSFACEVNP